VAELPPETEQSRIRLCNLLKNLIKIQVAHDMVSYRQAWREYAIHLTEYVYYGFDELKQIVDSYEVKLPLWERLEPIMKITNYRMCEDQKAEIFDLHWWLQIVKAREAGQLPAWEGIRLVREPDTHASKIWRKFLEEFKDISEDN
jgi:hypothetical protein